MIRFPRAGNQQLTGALRDVVFVVEEKPHPKFIRARDDLIVMQKLPLVEALIGKGERKVG